MARDPADRDPHRPGSVPEIAAKSRKEIAAGASEIAIDDFVDSALSERPKTGAPPAEPAPAPGRAIRETARGIGAAIGDARGGPPRPATPRAPAVFEAPETDRDRPRFSPSTTNFIAAKDQRISELEEQLAKAKQDLARQSRPHHPSPAVRTVPMQAVVPQAPPTGPKGGTLFMPVTSAPPEAPVAPRPAPAPPAPPLGVGATMFMPANQAPPAPAASPYPAVLDPSLQAAPARPQPAAHPSAQYPAVLDPRLQSSAAAPPPIQAPPPARPSAVIKSLMQEAIEQGKAAPPSPGHAQAPPYAPPPDPRRDPTAPPPPIDDDDTGGRTMMLDPSLPPPQLPVEPVAPVGVAPAALAAPYPSQHPPPAPPAHMIESTEKAFERPEPLVLAPKKRSLAGVFAVAAVLAIGLAGGAYAYRMELGPFATSKSASKPEPKDASTGAAATSSPVKPTATATSAPSAAPVATASATSTASASAAPEASAAPSAAPSATTQASAAPQVPGAPEDLGALLSFQAYLTVTSTADAEVVVQGQSAGRTNTRLMVRCGPRNVRLRGEGSKWLTEGQHVQLTCMQHTKVAIDPAK